MALTTIAVLTAVSRTNVEAVFGDRWQAAVVRAYAECGRRLAEEIGIVEEPARVVVPDPAPMLGEGPTPPRYPTPGPRSALRGMGRTGTDG